MRRKMGEREFQIGRQQALERDNHRCIVCESTDNLVIHHVKKDQRSRYRP